MEDFTHKIDARMYDPPQKSCVGEDYTLILHTDCQHVSCPSRLFVFLDGSKMCKCSLVSKIEQTKQDKNNNKKK